jgi:hypothetical protein
MVSFDKDPGRLRGLISVTVQERVSCSVSFNFCIIGSFRFKALLLRSELQYLFKTLNRYVTRIKGNDQKGEFHFLTTTAPLGTRRQCLSQSKRQHLVMVGTSISRNGWSWPNGNPWAHPLPKRLYVLTSIRLPEPHSEKPKWIALKSPCLSAMFRTWPSRKPRLHQQSGHRR